MSTLKRKPVLVVVSPFLDKSYGTERIAIEWLSRLTEEFEIHIYSQRVQGIDTTQIAWHRIPRLPGPHLLNYLWWLAANHVWRAWDRHFRDIRSDIVFSPGINCFDADVISVHIVFAEFLRQASRALKFTNNRVTFWPRLLHRRLYYRLIVFLERRIYTSMNATLILIAKKTAEDLQRFYDRAKQCFIFYMGLDHEAFNPQRRNELRLAARNEIGIPDDVFSVLLVGNDFHKKGVRTLLEAVSQLKSLRIAVLIAGNDDRSPFEALGRSKGIADQVHFLPPRPDVEFYYAAADAYAGPSLEDTFALPPQEAMACGLPVIVSSTNGTNEIITHESDGLILDNPEDAQGLAGMIRRLYEDESFRSHLGENASRTAAQYTWDRNVRELRAIFESVLQKKSQPGLPSLARQS